MSFAPAVDDQEQLRLAGIGERAADAFHRDIGNGDDRRRAIRFGHAEHAMQFARVEHRLDDVRTADQLAADVELRNRRPVAECLDAGADLFVGEHVHRLVVVEQRVEAIGRGRGEAALRCVARALHEQDDAVVGEQRLDARARGGSQRHGGFRKVDRQ
jgi:hypothetical protein